MGNYIKVPSSSIQHVVYKDNCDEGKVNGQHYFMDINFSRFSITLFLVYEKDSISIDGNLRTSGYGSIGKGSYQNNGWHGFWKQTVVKYYPAVNHLWVTNAPSANHIIPSRITTQNDTDILENVNEYPVHCSCGHCPPAGPECVWVEDRTTFFSVYTPG